MVAPWSRAASWATRTRPERGIRDTGRPAGEDKPRRVTGCLQEVARAKKGAPPVMGKRTTTRYPPGSRSLKVWPPECER